MSTTTKNVAKAIALLSDVLSTEVENESWVEPEEAPDEEIEETVSLDDYEDLVEKVVDFSADVYDDLSDLRDNLEGHVEDDEDDCTPSYYDDDDDEEESELDDDNAFVEDTNEEGEPTADTVPTGNIGAVAEAAAASTDLVPESDSDEVEELKSKVTQLEDVINDAVDTLNDIISTVENFKTEAEEC